jgi:hypothetical protein
LLLEPGTRGPCGRRRDCRRDDNHSGTTGWDRIDGTALILFLPHKGERTLPDPPTALEGGAPGWTTEAVRREFPIGGDRVPSALWGRDRERSSFGISGPDPAEAGPG